MKNPSLASATTAFNQVAWQGWVMAIIALVAYSSGPPVSKFAITQGMDPTTLVAMKYLLSIVLLTGTIRVTRPDRFRLNRSGLFFCLAVGLANGVAALAFSWSLTRISTSVATMTLALYPLLVLALLALRGEKLTYRHAIRLGLGLVGIYLLIGPGGQVDLFGILLVLIAGCAYATHLVLIQWFLPGYDIWTVTLYVVTAMAVLLTGLWLAQGATWPSLNWQSLLIIGWLAVVGTYLAQMALVAGVRSIGSGQMALLGPAQILLTVIWSFLFLHERLTVLQGLGGVLILSSMLLAVQRLRRAQF